MTTPNMNRLFTITASEETGTDSLIAWRYNRYATSEPPQGVISVSLPSTGGYVWAGGPGANFPRFFSTVNTADEIITLATTRSHGGDRDFQLEDLELGYNSVNADASPNTNLALPGAVLRGEGVIGREVRFYPASSYPAEPYIRFIAESRIEYPSVSGLFGEYFALEIRVTREDDGRAITSSIQLVGDNFTLERSTPIIVTVAGHTVGTTLSEPKAHINVWGRMIELPARQTVTTSGGTLVTSATAAATLTVRYQPSLSIGREVIDDLGREWSVESSQTTRDRRFIEYELTRPIPVVS